MEELLEVLRDIRDDIDYETEDNLIDGKVLDSFEIVTLVSEISDTFDITISAKYLGAGALQLRQGHVGYDLRHPLPKDE